MSDYLIKKETLDGIAVQSNELIGKNEAVSPAEIISDLTEVNSEVGSQSELIAQIASALEGKAGGSSGSIATCTVTISLYDCDIQYCIATIASDGIINSMKINMNTNNTNYIIQNVMKGSFIWIRCDCPFPWISFPDGSIISDPDALGTFAFLFIIPQDANDNVTINITNED